MTCIPIRGPGRSRGILCTLDYPHPIPNPTCPNAAQHEPFPTGYIAASDHADEMMKTHEQSQCPDCGLRAIWTPKASSEAAA